MKLLRDPEFQRLLVDYPRPKRRFTKAIEYEDSLAGSGRFPLRPLLERDRLLDLLFREVKVF